MNNTPASLSPPPWQLSGKGWIMLCQWPRSWLLENGWVATDQAQDYVGGPGALMLVDYQDCPIGPYRELLMVPGRFRTAAGVRPSISRILVSSQISVDNGRAHWAIPKTLGEFRIDSTAHGERWSVAENGQALARFELSERGPAIPVSTRWVPKALATIAQPSVDGWLLTTPGASGRIRWGALDASWSDPTGFPTIGPGRCLMTLRVSSFQMEFPLARHCQPAATR